MDEGERRRFAGVYDARLRFLNGLPARNETHQAWYDHWDRAAEDAGPGWNPDAAFEADQSSPLGWEEWLHHRNLREAYLQGQPATDPADVEQYQAWARGDLLTAHAPSAYRVEDRAVSAAQVDWVRETYGPLVIPTQTAEERDAGELAQWAYEDSYRRMGEDMARWSREADGWEAERERREADRLGAEIDGRPWDAAEQARFESEYEAFYQRYEAASAALSQCFPLKVTPAFGAILGESPIYLRFVNTPPTAAYQIINNVTIFAPQ